MVDVGSCQNGGQGQCSAPDKSAATGGPRMASIQEAITSMCRTDRVLNGAGVDFRHSLVSRIIVAPQSS